VLPANTILDFLVGELKELPLCSRSGPVVDGAWDPSPGEIDLLESKLPKLNNRFECGIDMNAYTRQYFGIVVQGQKVVYVNAFFGLPDSKLPWMQRFIDVCDGGNRAWGVLFYPATEGFRDFVFNGAFPE
jgi:hypothetical protein